MLCLNGTVKPFQVARVKPVVYLTTELPASETGFSLLPERGYTLSMIFRGEGQKFGRGYEFKNRIQIDVEPLPDEEFDQLDGYRRIFGDLMRKLFCLRLEILGGKNMVQKAKFLRLASLNETIRKRILKSLMQPYNSRQEPTPPCDGNASPADKSDLKPGFFRSHSNIAS